MISDCLQNDGENDELTSEIVYSRDLNIISLRNTFHKENLILCVIYATVQFMEKKYK